MFTAFLRALFCLPAGVSLRRRSMARKKRRERDNRCLANNQPPPRRWCDPIEPSSEISTVAAPPAARRPPQSRTQDLVPAKPRRRPVNDSPHVTTQEIQLPRRSRQFSTPRLPSPIPLVQAILESEQVSEVITTIGKSFPHFPCVVTGLAAMVHHGFTKRLPREVSLSFPARYRDVIRSWALCQGFLEIRGKPSCFGVLLSDQKIRCVRARFLETGFEGFRTVRAGDPAVPAKVLNLATIAVQIAKGYVAELNTADLWRQEVFAGDMRWTLRTMIRLGQVLRPFYASRIVQHQFWEPFTLSFPDTLPMFASVGLGPREVEILQSELERDPGIHHTLAPYHNG